MQITTVEQVLLLPSVPYRRRGFLPSASGLYFAVIDDEYVAYIGISATSIRQRWAGHNRKHTVQAMGAVRIAFVESSDIAALRSIERAAIVALEPPLNVHYRPRAAPTPFVYDDPEDELIGLTQASSETGLSREWLRRLYHAGELRRLYHAGELPGAQRVGNSIGIPRRHVTRLKDTPRRHGGWPKGKPRKPPLPPASGHG